MKCFCSQTIIPATWMPGRSKSRRFGFTVRIIDQVNPHPGDAYYLEAVAKQLTGEDASPRLYASNQHRRRSDACP